MHDIEIIRHPDGTITNFSRHHTINGKRGHGGMVVYEGEAKEVMELVMKHTNDSKEGNTK